MHHHGRPEPLDQLVGVGLGQPAAASRPDPGLAFEDRQVANLVAEPECVQGRAARSATATVRPPPR